MKLKLLTTLVLIIFCSFVSSQLFDEINSAQMQPPQMAAAGAGNNGYDDFSGIVGENQQGGGASEQSPRFSEVQRGDPEFLQSLASQAQNLITQKFGGSQQNALQPQSMFPHPQQLNNMQPSAYSGGNQGPKGFLPKELRNLDVVESENGHFKVLSVDGIKLEKNRLVINSDVKIKIGESDFSISQLEALVYFNMKLLKKCGKNLEYCMIKDNTDDLEYKSLEVKESDDSGKKSKDRFLEISPKRLSLLDQENEKLEKELNNLAEITDSKVNLAINPKLLEDDIDIY